MDFERYIIDIFRAVAGLNRTTINKYIIPNIDLFRKAFTHPSYGEENYETLEFFGDRVVNLTNAMYIRHRFPLVNSTRWLTKIKHNLGSKDTLYYIARQVGFIDYILADEQTLDILHSDPERLSDTNLTKYKSILEDVFEAFAQAVVASFDRLTYRGVGLSVAYAIHKKWYAHAKLSLNIDEVFDSKSRLKEIYDAQDWKPFQEYFMTKDPITCCYRDTRGKCKKFAYYKRDSDRTYYCEEHYPTGSFLINKPHVGRYVATVYIPDGQGGKEYITNYNSTNQRDAEEGAARKAMRILRKRGIEENAPSPYIERGEEETDLPPINPSFKDFVRKELELTSMKRSAIESLLTDTNLADLRVSLIHPSFSPSLNNNIYKFEGDRVLDLCFVEYISIRHPEIKDEGKLTQIRHKFLGSRKEYVNYIKYKKFLEEGLYVEGHHSEMDIADHLFKGFLGGIFSLLRKEHSITVAYKSCYEMTTERFSNVRIDVETKKIKDAKTELKEVYDRKGWPFSTLFKSEYDDLMEIYTVKVFYLAGADRQRKLLVTFSDPDQRVAENRASKNAMVILNEKIWANPIGRRR